MCLCLNVCMCSICVHAFAVCTSRVSICESRLLHVCLCICTYAPHVCMYECVQMYVHVCMYACAHMYVHVCMYACSHMYVHLCMYACAHKYVMCVCMCISRRPMHIITLPRVYLYLDSSRGPSMS
jgi:hypothetical protein